MKIVSMPGPENISVEWDGIVYRLYGAYEHGCLTVMPIHIVRDDGSEMSEKEKADFMQEAYRELHFDPPYRLDFEAPFNWKGELLYSEENGNIKYPDIKCTCQLLESIDEFSDSKEYQMASDMVLRAEMYGRFRKKLFPAFINGRKADAYRCTVCSRSWFVIRPDNGSFKGGVVCR